MDDQVIGLTIYWYGRNWFCMSPNAKRLFSWGVNAMSVEEALTEIKRQLNGAEPACDITLIPLETPCDATTEIILDYGGGLTAHTKELSQNIPFPPKTKNGKPDRKEG